MRRRAWSALARGVVLESVRKKDIWVVAILGLLMILAAGTLGVFGFDGLDLFAKDLAVSVVGVLSTVLAVLTSSRVLPDEIRHRTVYPLLARPITRLDLMIGKLAGAVVVSWVGFLALTFAAMLALAAFHVELGTVMIQYMIAKMLGIMLICSVTMTLSIYMTTSAAATLSMILAFASVMIVRALVIASATATTPMKAVYATLNSILPQYSLFDMGGRVVNSGWSVVPLWVMLALAAYMIAYSSGMMAIGWAKFRRQAI